MPRLPWYSFLYRLLGAQGTFWLWIVVVAAIWWTGKPALVRALNRTPTVVAVRVVPQAARQMIRWVEVDDGVLVRLDRRLLLDDQAPTFPPVDLLLDADDPAAQWWLETRALAQVLEGEASTAAIASGVGPDEAQALLIQRHAKLAGRQEGLIAPERAILVQGDRVPPLSAPLELVSRPTDAANFLEDLKRWADLVRQRVQPDQDVRGLLADCPPTVRDRLEDELDVVVVPYVLQAGREPRELESIVFGAASILFVFLATGLYGASRVKRDGEAGEGREPPATESPATESPATESPPP